MTTAYLDEAERCNRVGLMYRGKLIRCDAPETLKRNAGGASMETLFIETIRAAEAAGAQ
jgi:ABC-2 type transport system ATP-binding protein